VVNPDAQPVCCGRTPLGMSNSSKDLMRSVERSSVLTPLNVENLRTSPSRTKSRFVHDAGRYSEVTNSDQ